MEFSKIKSEAIGEHYTSEIMRVGLETATSTVLDDIVSDAFDYQNPTFQSLV